MNGADKTDMLNAFAFDMNLIREGKKPTRRTVKVGRKSGDRTEILEGLRRGQEIYAEKPEK